MIILAAKGCFWPLTASITSEAKIKYAYVITQGICNKFIKVKVWFHGQIVCSNIEHLSNIDEIGQGQKAKFTTEKPFLDLSKTTWTYGRTRHLIESSFRKN